MGYGYYSSNDWNKLKNSRGLNSNSNYQQTFTRVEINDKYNAQFVSFRESFDSDDSPESTPIIIGFDVTGSMGYLANEIATNSLNETIMQILSKKPVTDPHMMCAAFTNTSAPLQVTQFEADIRVVEQLLEFKLGGGNPHAADLLLWYFAAKHTKIDSFKKRGKKGILIGIGDEVCGYSPKPGVGNRLRQDNLKRVFDDDIDSDLSFMELYEMASEQYEVFHIVVGPEMRFKEGSMNSYKGWNEVLPGRVAKILDKNISCLPEVIVTILEHLNGKSIEEAASDIPLNKRGLVRAALEDFE